MVSTITSILPGDIRPSSSGTNDDLYDMISDNDVKGDVEFDEVPKDDVDEKEGPMEEIGLVRTFGRDQVQDDNIRRDEISWRRIQDK